MERVKETFEMPPGAFIRHVAAQANPNYVVSVWVEVDTDEITAPKETRTFELFETRAPIPDEGHYVGTIIGHNNMELHLYEIRPRHKYMTEVQRNILAGKTRTIVTDR